MLRPDDDLGIDHAISQPPAGRGRNRPVLTGIPETGLNGDPSGVKPPRSSIEAGFQVGSASALDKCLTCHLYEPLPHLGPIQNLAISVAHGGDGLVLLGNPWQHTTGGASARPYEA